MFAFALWDEQAADAVPGARPPRREAAVLRAAAGRAPDVRLRAEVAARARRRWRATSIRCAVEDYFALGYVPEPRTIFKSAQKLPPAHTLTVRRGAAVPAPRRILGRRALPLDQHVAAADAAGELRDRLARVGPAADDLRGSARRVPVRRRRFQRGCCDDGGLSATPVNTCSIAFADPALRRIALRAAGRRALSHATLRRPRRKRRLRPDRHAGAALRRTVCGQLRDTDLPRLPARAQHVTVALSGDGGDETFGGYRRYRLHMMEERMRQPLPLALRRPMFGLLGRASIRRPTGRRACCAARPPSRRLRATRSRPTSTACRILRDATAQPSVFERHCSAALGGYNAIEVFRRHAAAREHDDPLALIQYLDLKTYLVGDINTKVDRASMAHSLEVREPLMDHPLVEWLATLPSSFKLRGGEGKWLFKKAMEPIIASRTFCTGQKMGFAVPLASWLRGPLRQRVRDVVLGDGIAETGFFDIAYLRQLLEQHLSGSRDHSAPLWSVLMFDAFMKQEWKQPSAESRVLSA